MFERPNGRSSTPEMTSDSSAGIVTLAARNSATTSSIIEREALLLEPAAALDVVDPAERGVHRPPERGADPEPRDDRDDADLGRVVPNPHQRVRQRALLGSGEELLQVAQHGRFDVRALQDLAEDEEHQQGEGKDREHQVVGDHRRHSGDVLLISPAPEGDERPAPRNEVVHWRSTAPRRAAAARPATRRPSVAAPPASESPARASSSSSCSRERAADTVGSSFDPAAAAACARDDFAAASARRGLRTEGRVRGRLPRIPGPSRVVGGRSRLRAAHAPISAI